MMNPVPWLQMTNMISYQGLVRTFPSGRNPDDVKRRRKAEVDDNRELGLVYDTDPANDKGGTSAEVKEPDAPSSESQRKK